MLKADNSTKMWPDSNHIGMNLIVTDDERPDLGSGEQVVISKTIIRQFVKGEDMSNTVRDSIGKEAQDLIAKYKAERAMYVKAIYQTKIDQIIGALSL
jgi:hypothetical protein